MAYQDVVTALSPTSYWPLDEAVGSGTATDEMGAVNGTYSSVTLGQEHIVANSTMTSGYFQYTLPSSVAFGNNYDFTGTPSFTALCWVKLLRWDSSTGHNIWGNQENNFGWGLALEGGGITIACARGDGVATDRCAFDVGIQAFLNKRHLIAAWYNGADLKLYYDGSFVDTEPSTRSISPPPTFTSLKLGEKVDGGSGWMGIMGHAAIWNGTALTEAQLDSLWYAGSDMANVSWWAA